MYENVCQFATLTETFTGFYLGELVILVLKVYAVNMGIKKKYFIYLQKWQPGKVNYTFDIVYAYAQQVTDMANF